MKKICVITTSLGKGGAERYSALLSRMLSNMEYDVHILMTKNDIDYEYSGQLFSVQKQLADKSNVLNKISILKSYFKGHNFDVIIDNRTRSFFLKELILYQYVFKAESIISVIHSYYLQNYLPKSKFLAKWIYEKNSKLIAVSKEIHEIVINQYQFKNCVQIYNPVDFDSINSESQKIDVKGEFILYYGRIEESVKNFTLLLTAYKESSLPKKKVRLLVIGDGNDIGFLKRLIDEFELENTVSHMPFTKNPFDYVKQSLFTVLTSKHEGFPSVIVESLACGTPVVSVDCKSGPKEIIQDRFNGLLVENNNPKLLANAFDTFIHNKTLYNICKKNAKKSVERFSMDEIAKKWKTLLG